MRDPRSPRCQPRRIRWDRGDGFRTAHDPATTTGSLCPGRKQTSGPRGAALQKWLVATRVAMHIEEPRPGGPDQPDDGPLLPLIVTFL